MPVTQTPWEEKVEQAMQVCINTFGEGDDNAVEYTHLGGTPYTLNGIFEAESVNTDPDTGLQIKSNQPQISFRLSQLQQMPDVDDTVLVRGYLYRVVDPQFDGQGTVTLRLHIA